jgi:hypothetical protein
VTLNEESHLNAKGYSERDEKRILDALGRGLLNEFPNPDRSGCPGSDVLRRIAVHQMPLAEAEHWLDHLTSCSPCYGDFNQFRDSYHLVRRRTILAIAASILVVATGATWWVIHTNSEIRLAQNTVLDLRNRSVARGSEPVPTEPPLEIPRSVSHLDIFLPLGSSEGPYDVRIVTGSGESILNAKGAAKLNNHITSMRLELNLSSARTGAYIFQVRRDTQDWNSYPLVLK